VLEPDETLGPTHRCNHSHRVICFIPTLSSCDKRNSSLLNPHVVSPSGLYYIMYVYNMYIYIYIYIYIYCIYMRLSVWPAGEESKWLAAEYIYIYIYIYMCLQPPRKYTLLLPGRLKRKKRGICLSRCIWEHDDISAVHLHCRPQTRRKGEHLVSWMILSVC